MNFIFPNDFSAHARASVIAAEVEASREVERTVQNRGIASLVTMGLGTHLSGTEIVIHYIMSVFTAFSNEAFGLGNQGRWTADRIVSESREFLRLTAIMAESKYGAWEELDCSPLIDRGGGEVRADMRRRLEATEA